LLKSSAIQTALTTLGTILPLDNTISQITEGDEFLSVAITPTNASSILRITVTALVGCASANTNVSIALFVDATANALNATRTFCGGSTFATTVTLQLEVSAGST